MCIKDQLSQHLPQLVQIKRALYECGILGHMGKDKELWKPVSANANCFTIAADEFLDQIIVSFSESQLRREAEFNTYKFFSDVIESIEKGGTFLISFQTDTKVKREAFVTNLNTVMMADVLPSFRNKCFGLVIHGNLPEIREL